MNKTNSVVNKLSLFAFFDDFVLIYPFYTLMFADSGITPVKISSLLVIWSLTAFVLEIPAGSLADKHMRKHVLTIGIFMRVIGFAFWLFMRNYLGFVIGFIFWGLKSALASGTFEALVYDELNRIGKLPLYGKLMGRLKALSSLGIILSAFTASLISGHSYSFILWLSIIALVISGVAIISLPKATIVQEAKETTYLKILKEGFNTVTKKPLILFLIGFMSVVAGLGAIDEYFNLFLRQKGFTNSSIAILFGIIFIFGATGSILAHKLEKRKVPVRSALFGWAALLLFTTIAPKYLAPVLLGFYSMFFFGVEVLFNSHLQKQIGDKTRATITSIGGFGAELIAILSFVIVGFGANRAGYIYAFRLISLGVIVFALGIAFYAQQHKIVF